MPMVLPSPFSYRRPHARGSQQVLPGVLVDVPLESMTLSPGPLPPFVEIVRCLLLLLRFFTPPPFVKRSSHDALKEPAILCFCSSLSRVHVAAFLFIPSFPPTPNVAFFLFLSPTAFSPPPFFLSILLPFMSPTSRRESSA